MNYGVSKIDEQIEKSAKLKPEGRPDQFLEEARRDVRRGSSSEFARIWVLIWHASAPRTGAAD